MLQHIRRSNISVGITHIVILAILILLFVPGSERASHEESVSSASPSDSCCLVAGVPLNPGMGLEAPWFDSLGVLLGVVHAESSVHGVEAVRATAGRAFALAGERGVGAKWNFVFVGDSSCGPPPL